MLIRLCWSYYGAEGYVDSTQTLKDTRQCLTESSYEQIPQLSVGEQFDLNMPIRL